MKGTVLLPLRPQTSTSLSVWVQASLPDVGELFQHHSCSREAEDNHNKYQLQLCLENNTQIYLKKGTFTKVPTFGTMTLEGCFELH